MATGIAPKKIIENLLQQKDRLYSFGGGRGKRAGMGRGGNRGYNICSAQGKFRHCKNLQNSFYILNLQNEYSVRLYYDAMCLKVKLVINWTLDVLSYNICDQVKFLLYLSYSQVTRTPMYQCILVL